MRAFKSWLDASNNTIIRLLPFPISLLKLGISKRGCGHADPNSFAALFPDQGLKDSGRANLDSLTGGLAYGIPRYSYTNLPFGSVSSLPTIVPDEVCTSASQPLIWDWRVFLWYKSIRKMDRERCRLSWQTEHRTQGTQRSEKGGKNVKTTYVRRRSCLWA